MKSRYPMRPIDEALERVERLVDVQPTITYPMLGVRSFGRGAFAAADLSGTETRYPRFLRVERGDVVYPKLMAWEGAFALVEPELAGRHVSPEFCTFVATERSDPRYVAYALQTPWIAEMIAGASGGTNLRRRRLYPDDFLAREIPLPEINEQRRIATHLDSVRRITRAVSARSGPTSARYEAASDAAIQKVLDDALSAGWEMRLLSDVADINPGRTKLAQADRVAFVPMRAVDGFLGAIADYEVKRVDDIGSGYKQFQTGDVIFARITPCMQNGKTAIVTDKLPEFGYGSTEFHVVRPIASVAAEWIHAVMRTRDFRLAAAERFTGTAGQQRVPASFLEEVTIPVPPNSDEQTRALAKIDSLTRSGNALRALAERRDSFVAALLPSALNRAFAGLA